MIKCKVVSEENLDLFNKKIEEILNSPKLQDVLAIDYSAVSCDDNTLNITRCDITYTAMIVYEEND